MQNIAGFDLKGAYCVYENGVLTKSAGLIVDTYIAILEKYLNKENIVLDIGCGLGQLAFQLSKTSKKVFAIDPSVYNIESAKVINKADNIEYLFGDGTDIKFPDRFFDIVVSSEAIEHVRDFNKVILEMYRIGKDNAVYCISSPNLLILLLYPFYWIYGLINSVKYLKIITMNDSIKDYEALYDRWFYPWTLKKYLIKNGFTVEKLITRVTFTSRKYYERRFKRFTGLLSLVSNLDNIAYSIYSKLPYIKENCQARVFILFKKTVKKNAKKHLSR